MAHLGYYNMHTVNPIGNSGGLALMCTKSVTVKILQSDKRIIVITL